MVQGCQKYSSTSSDGIGAAGVYVSTFLRPVNPSSVMLCARTSSHFSTTPLAIRRSSTGDLFPKDHLPRISQLRGLLLAEVAARANSWPHRQESAL